MSFAVKFWGVRGSIACPSPDHIGYGGNTSCVEMKIGDERIIFDAGTGLKVLGESMLQEKAGHSHLLLSHTHWDHINGFPFFVPAYMPDFALTIMAGHAVHEGGIKQLLSGQMAQPFFPIPLDAMQSKINFVDFKSGDEINITDEINIQTLALNHPNGSTGYRVNYKGRSVCYITDTEHVPGKMDESIRGFIKGSDLVIYDSTYTEEEFPAKVGWGHSTWVEGVKLCESSDVKMLAIFHHDPSHTDDIMEKIERESRELWAGAIVAREKMQIDII